MIDLKDTARELLMYKTLIFLFILIRFILVGSNSAIGRIITAIFLLVFFTGIKDLSLYLWRSRSPKLSHIAVEDKRRADMRRKDRATTSKEEYPTTFV